MALFVNTNVSSLNARRQLSLSTNKLDRTYTNLASGLRINSARDDAAGLQISNRLTSQINGLDQGNRNAIDGISLLQTAEGAMDEMTVMLQRIRPLALQSANGTNGDSDRLALQEEVSALSSEINRISRDTSFSGKKLLDGENEVLITKIANKLEARVIYRAPTGDHPRDGHPIDKFHESKEYTFQVGADANQTVLATIGIPYTGNVYHYAEDADTYMCNPNVETQMNLGVNLNSFYIGMKGANTDSNRIVERDAELSQHTTGFTLTTDNNISFDVSTATSSQKVIEYVDSFITKVDGERAELGAVQNRLDSSVRNQSTTHENVSGARSRIRDADFARETALLTENNILNQASQTVLSQANSLPELALRLLQN